MRFAKPLALLATAVSARALPTSFDPSADTIGLLINNFYGGDIYVSGDWAAKDVAKHGAMPNQSHILANGSSVFVKAFPGTSPKYYFGITPNEAGPQVGSKRDHDTVFEATFIDEYGKTFYDIDVERGFSVPLWCHGSQEDWTAGKGCEGDLLSTCPEKLQHLDKDGVVDQCRSEPNRMDILRRREVCPRAYIVYDDDKWGVEAIDPPGSAVVVCTITDPNNSTRTARLRPGDV
ncbi:hypothetical protein MBLNU457_6575t1 [Dothideomycetes sp. NU457]